MEFTLTTPALLFPAISLLLLAYTNRFYALASLIRGMKRQYQEEKNPSLLPQISNLKKRIFLIRNMQACGISSFFLCVVCMLLHLNGQVQISIYIFGFSLILLMISLYLSFREIQISVNALKIELKDMENILEETGK